MMADGQKQHREDISSRKQDVSTNRLDSAAEAQTYYLGKARELADSYPFLIQRKAELEKEIEESRSWFYTREDAIYKLSMGAHEESERVQTSGISNTVERTVLNCDSVLASMNRELQDQRKELFIEPYRDVCDKIELFEISLRGLRGETRLVAEQLYVQQKKMTEIQDAAGKRLGRRKVEAEREKILSQVARVLDTQDRREFGNGETAKANAPGNERPESDGESHMPGLREGEGNAGTG